MKRSTHVSPYGFLWLCCIICHYFASTTLALFVSTSVPPLLDVPTYSLATVSPDGSTAMNILTYASPASTTPKRMWTISLFRGTQTHENFLREKRGILQLLSSTHSNTVKLLGGSSSRNVNKGIGCASLGHGWVDYPISGGKQVKVLPGCVGYIHLALAGEMIDCGGHDVAICTVEEMMHEEGNDALGARTTDTLHLSTAYLRTKGLISDMGRVVE